MITSKNVNRLYLFTVILYVTGSIGAGYIFPPKMSIYVKLLITQGFIMLPILFYSKIKGIHLKSNIPLKSIKLTTVVLVIICTYLFIPLLNLVNLVSLLFTEASAAQLTMNMEQNLLLNGLFIAVLPAIVEETMFRGIIYQTYRKQKLLGGIILSSFLFGCMHMNFNQFFYTFVFGMFLALIIEATGSIFSAMLAHFTMNFNSVLMTFFMDKFTKAMGGSGSTDITQVNGRFIETMDTVTLQVMIIVMIVWAGIAIFTTAGAVGIYIAISKICNRYDYIKGMFKNGTKERLISIPLIIAIIITFYVMIFMR